ncbi:putative carboxyvinyl-carboxyphosphonate phosphorylmutase [Bordetella bronchiseptica E014]|uniref:isocitrate lyase/PEP mutase family protein n=1 Tax=Bordetella bronchiseptica TaxID=518 RepID=UPI00045A13D4|nr:oxaloacetate decarboxylase [Bordetella bronchiseptica]AUL16994.1 carboxyvinyl-carboxyphosphonate phosphorylmutase [Bordetella bronchiseptica]AWP60222.1 carboxyvinyl-carboxyphosphonate phosphorylmutase [Bordetella bronchiseptica]KAK71955.1 putative carboxyvinyl-carboxyphosphonate phosphorylmutase [Bordetella bronchiseptica CA90 BB02]KCV56534.1 putative carboxyvinyl-carboxyphosphonate phosphorylmutase [Bordetella bronchiseptica 7E71]KDC14796.1 putative carboxyvinyl-carboxyphosphonate phosphor
MSNSTKRVLRERVAQRNGMLVAGAFNAMSARIVADQGFKAVYLTGAGLTNMHYGAPDLGIIGLRDVADATSRIRDAVELPLIVDADTGFGNAVNVWHTVRVLERAGADAIQLEDQVFPKRCGHFAGKSVAPLSEMVSKIKAAADARRDEDFLIIARTDARAVEGFDAAIERARRFAEAGADILFVEAIVDQDEVGKLPQLLSQPLLVNIVVGGKTPPMPAAQLGRLGYSVVLYANATLQGAVLGMQRALGALRRDGKLDEDPALLAPFLERQRLVGKPLYDELEERYKDA